MLTSRCVVCHESDIITSQKLSLAGWTLARLAIRQIGGQTGDILGAFEQIGEILILLVAAAFQMGR